MRTTRLPSAKDSGVACWATSRADQLGPAGEHARDPQVDVPAVVVDEPADGDVEQLRVALVGEARRTPWRGPVRRLGARGDVRAGPDAGPRRSARARVLARSSPSAWCWPVCPGLLGARSSVDTASPPRRPRRNRAPASIAGTSSSTAAVTSTCSAPATSSASWAAAVAVELGEDVVEDQDRVVAVGAQQVVGRQPQRQRERPGLAVAGVAADRQPGSRPPGPRLSSRSSRCGPTSETPRSSSS